jgi:hypothetical protein
MIRRSSPGDETWAGYKARFPSRTVSVAKRLFEQLERYVETNRLSWSPTLRPNWPSYKQGRENRVTIIMRTEDPIKLCIKLRASPKQLGLGSPYPYLKDEWDSGHKEWVWEIPTAGPVPDLSLALDLVPKI